jgi:Na+/proline symporter
VDVELEDDMPLIATILVFASILLPAGLYIALSLAERRHIHSLADFFPLKRYLEAGTYSRSTVAAGVSLATVILALVNLAPFLGISLLVTIASYTASFVLLYFAAPAILRRNPTNQTVQSFLGTAYGSTAVRWIALAFTFVGYVSIFSMELLVGVTVLEPFLGQWVLAFSIIYLFFIIAYSMISGFRAIVATEQWQLRFIIAAVAMLPAFLILLALRSPNAFPLAPVTAEIFGSWKATLPFVLGIIAMNLPAAISDAGTWQRLCSTRSETDARRGLLGAIPMFVLLWGTLILVSCYISTIAIATHRFDPAVGTLTTFLVSSLSNGDALSLAMLFVFMLGLFSAMITTADSLLLVAAQMCVIDVLQLHNREILADRGLRRSRLVLALIALLSFAIFAVFQIIKFDVVQLIFAIYGAQLALFPAVAGALFLTEWFDLRRAGLAASASILVGFCGAWGSAVYGQFSKQTAWMYNAPVVALVGAALVFSALSVVAWRGRAGRRA